MKALIAMSGGVDSSVAAKLTMEAGYECIGCTMKLFNADDVGISDKKGTPSAADDAREIAEHLGITFYVLDLQNAFRRCVIDKFINSYARGVTPNPCIDCNRDVKFGALLQKADALGCDRIVTGHYARVEHNPITGKYLLRKALDASKDQSYVLYTLTQDQLARVILPLGTLTKAQVRKLAGADGFNNADQPESQDICFVPDGDYASVIKQYTSRTFPEGDYVDFDGNVIGKHKGIIHYTIGQTRGLGQSFGEKRYVCRIDAEKNQVVLGHNEDVFSSYAKASDFNWISGEPPEGEIRCRVRVRYKQEEQWATVYPIGIDAAEILFDEPQRAITPGQAAVLYDEDVVLGGGTLV
ncbi:MAG: tRNA 2-thiouridine(34) synthase MnmA [Clostridia bacterium]|nr:tRNA 2-thiouridine(34) synthase MnmA [Clostridia bacterium]